VPTKFPEPAAPPRLRSNRPPPGGGGPWGGEGPLPANRVAANPPPPPPPFSPPPFVAPPRAAPPGIGRTPPATICGNHSRSSQRGFHAGPPPFSRAEGPVSTACRLARCARREGNGSTLRTDPSEAIGSKKNRPLGGGGSQHTPGVFKTRPGSPGLVQKTFFFFVFFFFGRALPPGFSPRLSFFRPWPRPTPISGRRPRGPFPAECATLPPVVVHPGEFLQLHINRSPSTCRSSVHAKRRGPGIPPPPPPRPGFPGPALVRGLMLVFLVPSLYCLLRSMSCASLISGVLRWGKKKNTPPPGFFFFFFFTFLPKNGRGGPAGFRPPPPPPTPPERYCRPLPPALGTRKKPKHPGGALFASAAIYRHFRAGGSSWVPARREMLTPRNSCFFPPLRNDPPPSPRPT